MQKKKATLIVVGGLVCVLLTVLCLLWPAWNVLFVDDAQLADDVMSSSTSSVTMTTTTATTTAITTTTTTTKFASTTTSSTTKHKETTTEAPCPSTEPGHQHSFIIRVVEPDCQEEGYTRYTCTCGYTYTDNPTPKVGHRSTWVMVAASTPTEEGLIRHYCNVCGETLREETIPKKKNPYNIDSRVKITKAMFTNKPVYEFKQARVIDGRTWGEAPIIEILEDNSMRVTYYNLRNEKIVFIVEQHSKPNCHYRAEIANDGTYACVEFTPVS